MLWIKCFYLVISHFFPDTIAVYLLTNSIKHRNWHSSNGTGKRQVFNFFAGWHNQSIIRMTCKRTVYWLRFFSCHFFLHFHTCLLIPLTRYSGFDFENYIFIKMLGTRKATLPMYSMKENYLAVVFFRQIPPMLGNGSIPR